MNIELQRVLDRTIAVGKLRTARVMPAQKPHRSVQVVETPWEFIDAVEKRFGKIVFDLAATLDNCKVRKPAFKKGYYHYGPGSRIGRGRCSQARLGWVGR